MRVTLAKAEALLVLCAADTGGEAAALAHIAEVDPPSAGVALTQVLKYFAPALPFSIRCVVHEVAQSPRSSVVSCENFLLHCCCQRMHDPAIVRPQRPQVRQVRVGALRRGAAPSPGP